MRRPAVSIGFGLLALAGFAVTTMRHVGEVPVHFYLPDSPIVAFVDKALSPNAAPSVTPSDMKLVIRSIGVEAPLEELVAQPDGQLQTPAKWEDAGWYVMTPRPGLPGASVIVGHVDSHTGPAVFYRLNELRPGDEILVQDGTEETRFRVSASANYPEYSPKLEGIFAATSEQRLDLLTCSGDFNRYTQRYNSRLVVEATRTNAS